MTEGGRIGMIGEETLKLLKQALADSTYTVAVCGSGMMEEGGILGLKQEGRAYEIERKYGESPEELFHISCFSRRPELFYDFYRQEILDKVPRMTPSVRALARMEELGMLQCMVTTSIFDLPKEAGIRNVIYLHGGIYDNTCTHCGRKYSMDYMQHSKHVPLCEDCGHIVRPGTYLYGEMVDSQMMSRTTQEISKADVLLVLGTSLRSEVYSHYIRYFQGRTMIIVHREPRPLDEKADMVIYDLPQNVLPLLAGE